MVGIVACFCSPTCKIKYVNKQEIVSILKQNKKYVKTNCLSLLMSPQGDSAKNKRLSIGFGGGGGG